MKYLHIKNLEEYNPGYKDRELIWCKAYFKMNSADPEFEMLCEIDKWRFLAFVMLELQVKKPIPLNEEYLVRKGFDFRKRSLDLTVSSLILSIEIYNDVMKPVEIVDSKEPEVDSGNPGCIYFLKSSKKNIVKIGYTKFLEERIKQLNRKNEDDLKIICLIEGTIQDEHNLHEKFSNYEVSPEWFKYEAEVIEYINSLQTLDIKHVTEKYGYRTAGVTQSRVEKSREEKIRLESPSPIKFLEFVFMTQGQYDQLAQKLGKTVLDKYVERLNNYIGSKGKKYKSHYHTILSWVSKDGTQAVPAKRQEKNEALEKIKQWEKEARHD